MLAKAEKRGNKSKKKAKFGQDLTNDSSGSDIDEDTNSNCSSSEEEREILSIKKFRLDISLTGTPEAQTC